MAVWRCMLVSGHHKSVSSSGIWALYIIPDLLIMGVFFIRDSTAHQLTGPPVEPLLPILMDG